MTDTIIKIQPSDLISDSMVKINRNFEIISTRDDVVESKLNQWAENIESQLDDIRNENGIISSTLLNNVNKLDNKINNLTDLDGITKEVQNAINNATIDVESLINEKAGEAISSKLGDYVKTSTLNGILDGYVTSTAFDTYKSDSSKSSAQSSRIVANSKFLKLPNDDNDGVECLVRTTGEITEFESVEDYFKSLSASEKAEILGDKTFSSDDKALEDPDVIAKLIEVCERTFKTVVSQMSIISQTVGPDNVENSIIAAVNGANGEQITASIFAKANETDSEITLNADKILINSGKTLNVQSGGNISVKSGGNFKINSGGKFQITSTNFNIDSSGNVSVTGAIEATSLKITGSSGLIDISDETKLSNFVKSHQDTVSGDVEWLKNALNGGTTTIDGGLVLSNAILTKDSDDNITAGMIGENTSENDIRFFAGSNMTDINNAPFRVYEDGKLVAKNAELIDGSFSGLVSFPFKSLDWCSEVTDYILSKSGNENQYIFGTYVRTLNIDVSASIEIGSDLRYSGDYHGSGGPRTQYIKLPDDLPDGVVINILATGYSYKNAYGPVYIGARHIYYGTNDESYYGTSLEEATIYPSSGLSKWLCFPDVFYLRLLHFGNGEYYLIQSLGKYTIVESEAPTGSYYYGQDGIGTFDV